MSKYRSRLEIVRDVLLAVQNGVDKPTGIMYAANLSHRLGKDVLNYLVQHGLLRMRDTPGNKKSRKSYHLTEKGLNVIRHLDRAKEIMNTI